MIAGEVEHDRPEVGDHARVVPDPVERPAQPDERLLHDVLGRVAIDDEEAGHADELGWSRAAEEISDHEVVSRRIPTHAH